MMELRPIGKNEAKKIINPYRNKIESAVNKSIKHYLTGEEYATVRFRHTPRTDASIIHDLIVDEIENEFLDVTGTYFQRKKNLFCLVIDDKVILRFKKFNDNLLGSGINTRQLIAFNLQDSAQLDLPDMPADGLLYVGYRLNELKTNLKDLHITYRYNKYNVWTWDITSNENEVIKPIEIPVANTTQTTTRKVTAKINDKSVGDKSEGNS